MRNINTNTTSTSTDLYQVTTLYDGTMLFRYWTQDNCEYYDMGNVYCITKK